MSAYLEPLEDGPRCKKWNLVKSEGSGRERKRRSEVFLGGKRAALAALKEFDARTRIVLDADSFAGFASRWNASRYKTSAITASTFENYGHLLNGLAMHMGKPLHEVSPSDVEAALAALKDGDSPSGKPWSGTSLRTAYKVLSKMFDDARSKGLVSSNPCDSVKPPKGDTRKRKALSIEQTTRMLDRLDAEDAHEFAVALMLLTGMRAGECLGVTWNDVCDSGIVISREVTKTDSGARIVPLTETAWDYLAERMAWIAAKMEGAGAEPDFDDRLCCTDDGRAMTYDAMKHWWARNGLEGWTLHEMRHTFATNLAQANVHPSTMASLLGHSSSEITMEIYTHVHNEDLENAQNALESARKNARKPFGKGNRSERLSL